MTLIWLNNASIKKSQISVNILGVVSRAWVELFDEKWVKRRRKISPHSPFKGAIARDVLAWAFFLRAILHMYMGPKIPSFRRFCCWFVFAKSQIFL